MADRLNVEVATFGDTFVIHFGCELPRINAYTLAAALVGFADAAKAANAAINPGHEIEIVVEALDAGSFKATLRTLYGLAANIFSRNDLRAIVLGVLSTYIYEKTIGSDPTVQVQIYTNNVIIIDGDTRLVVPREYHDCVDRLAKNPGFVEGVGAAMRAVESDASITSIGFSPDPALPKPPLEIPARLFANLAKETLDPVDRQREIEEVTDLQILRAILERSRRLWQFAWHGVRISAPVTDQRFYDDFIGHKVTIAPGDVLRVRMKVTQHRNDDLGVFINTAYEIVEVFEHRAQAQQEPLDVPD